MVIKNHLQFLEKIFKRKEGIADAYRVDKIDFDNCSFYYFLDVFTQNNKIIRFNKGFEYATFAVKKFEYDDYITKESFYLSSELRINKYEMTMEQKRNLSRSINILIPEQVTILNLCRVRCSFIIIKTTM